MKYVILRTRYFHGKLNRDTMTVPVEERRDIIDQVFGSRGAAEYALEDLEDYHDRGNACSVYWLDEGEHCEPTYEILPIAA